MLVLCVLNGAQRRERSLAQPRFGDELFGSDSEFFHGVWVRSVPAEPSISGLPFLLTETGTGPL